MKHGKKTIIQAMVDAENGHEVMASVMLTMEMLYIKKACSEDHMAYLDDAAFDQLNDLFDEISTMEATLRMHNTMKMAVFGILNKQKSNVSSIQFCKYVFSMEDGVVRYYVLEGISKGEEEGSFAVINVYDVQSSQPIKRSRLESVLTLGMGQSVMNEASADDDKRFCFKVSVLTDKKAQQSSQGEQAEGSQDPAPAIQTQGLGSDGAPSAGISEGVPPEPPEATIVEEPESGEQEGLVGESATSDTLESAPRLPKGKYASKALGMGRRAARRMSVAASSTASASIKRAEEAELADDDLRSIIRNKLVAGREKVEFMASSSMIVAAPDQKSKDMWQVALQPLLQTSAKYCMRRPVLKPMLQRVTEPEPEPEPELQPEPEPEPEPEAAHDAQTIPAQEAVVATDFTGTDEGAEGGDKTQQLEEWRACHAVLFKPHLILCNQKGGSIFESLELWKVLPSSVAVCMEADVTGVAVLSFTTSDGVQHYIDCLNPDVASTWMETLRKGQAARGEADKVETFIVHETQRLSDRADALTESARKAKVAALASSVGALADTDGETRWVGDGVRKGIVGCVGVRAWALAWRWFVDNCVVDQACALRLACQSRRWRLEWNERDTSSCLPRTAPRRDAGTGGRDGSRNWENWKE
jgi:hypothetical protein